MRITFASPSSKISGTLAVGVPEGGKLGPLAVDLNKASDGALMRAIEASRFDGAKNELLEILAPAGLDSARLLLIGVGDPASLSSLEMESIGGSLIARLNSLGETDASLLIESFGTNGAQPHQRAARVALGARLRHYRFDKYKTTEKIEKKLSMKTLSLLCEKPGEAKKAYASLAKVAEGVFTSRNVISEPANVIFPKSFVEEAQKLEELGVKVSALTEKEMKKLGMNALLAVGEGSEKESRLLVMEWRGAGPKDSPIALVGKGVCFDSGGISIKPAAGMEDMKWDMGGAGVVLGAMQALAGRKAKANVIGICGLVENMPDGKAQRPGDIVTSMSGQTIEVLNTDAEGRLVLADALTYVQRTFKPKMIVDLATLTGAILVALGKDTAGLFSNDDALSEQLTAAGKDVGEPVWRLPLGEVYDRIIDGDAADMKNTGGRWAGSITAAQFVQRYIENDTPWAHLDIAGVTWAEKDKPTVPKGASAFGVRLLDNLVASHYES